jgi:hypothetical protein
VAEGAPLLREYRVYSPIEGSNPSLSANYATLQYIASPNINQHGTRQLRQLEIWQSDSRLDE